MAQIPQHKAELRKTLLLRRTALNADSRAQWDAAIGNRLTAWLEMRSPRTLGVYWPIRAEPDLREFYAQWAARGMQLALPAVIDKNAPLKFLAWNPGEPLAKDAMGVMMPGSAGAEVHPDALLVPCVGFSAQRFRLGYGAGFYDRTLASSLRPTAIGVAYSCLRTDFAVAGHDVALDVIVTEETTL